MKFVKVSVVVMGLLIFLGMVLLVYGFVTRIGKAPSSDMAAQDSAPLVPLSKPAAGFGDIPVTLEEGEIIIEMQSDAARMMLRTKMPDGSESIRVFDLTSGAALGRFVIRR